MLYMCIEYHIYIYKRTANTHTLTHTHSHTHTHTHTRTHARTHTDCSRNWVLILVI